MQEQICVLAAAERNLLVSSLTILPPIIMVNEKQEREVSSK
jgi:hypothetical protein